MNNKDFEPIRIRIMQEAYELADRGDAEGYNSVKVMCNDVQNLLMRKWVGLTDNQLVDLVIKHAGFPTKLAEAIEAKLKEKNGF
jgi:hypothetical protein